MLTYPLLANAARQGRIDLSNPATIEQLDAYLTDQWIDDYSRLHRGGDVVEVRLSQFKYLFDVRNEHLLSAWGQSRGRDPHVRDKTRMAGYPLGGPAGYHRGHSIPHRLGGGTDINLVAQNGAVNIGPFRELERKAVATPGALYFVYWTYPAGSRIRPNGSQQGFLAPGGALELRSHLN